MGEEIILVGKVEKFFGRKWYIKCDLKNEKLSKEKVRNMGWDEMNLVKREKIILG